MIMMSMMMIRFIFGRHGISTNTIYEHRTPSTKRTLEDANPVSSVVHAEDRTEHWALKLTGYDDEDEAFPTTALPHYNLYQY